FLNMLRVVKVTSPMSVGSWLITAFGGASAAAAASEVTGRLPRAGAGATAAAAVVGPAICTYTAALICDTAVPAWHEAHREMPYLFAGSAASAAGGLGMMAAPVEEAGQAIRFAVLGAATELTAKSLLLKRLGETAEPYQTGRSGKLMEAAEVLTAAGLAGTVLAGRSRAAIMLSGAALVASSALTRFGIFEAGRASARDPKYVVRPQRERLAAKARELAP
ncbi:MAG: NrfD/PsrC family molybdoenzyme membrane anchor subunit, partial [Streptosporangiaceae bacterium]